MQNFILSDTPDLSTSTTALMLSSHHNRFTKKSAPHKKLAKYVLYLHSIIKPKTERQEAKFNSKSYNDGLQRAFNKAKQQVFFNSDMEYFITLTYAENMQDIDQAMHDVKMLMKRTRRRSSNPAGSGRDREPKYIYVFEYQERGAIHVHMIANSAFLLQVNKNGHLELVDWPKGYSSVLQISDFDNNFRPYLYLFKYMKKAQRIGKSFVHSSKNLKNYYEIVDQHLNIEDWDTKNQERTETHINDLHFYFYKYYLKRVIVTPPINMEKQYG